MSNAAIFINNETSGFLSIDAEFGKNSGKLVRARLNPRGSSGSNVDVGDIASLEEMNVNPQIQALLSAGKISFTVVRGTTDIQGPLDYVKDAASMGGTIQMTYVFGVGVGAADDLTLFAANFPFAARLVDAQLLVSTAVAGATAQVRTLAGGLGSAYTDAFSAAATGRVRDAGAAIVGVAPTLAKNDSLFLRRAVSAVTAGMLILTFARLS